MRRYTNTVLSRKGTPVPGVSISVYPAGSTATLATIYENTDETVQINQTNFKTDMRGEFTFCAADGTYDIHFDGPGVSSLIWHDIQLQDANPSWFDVTEPQYGAVGDGATNDSVAIQAAIAACGSAGGGVVYLPRGTYRIQAPLQIVESGVQLVGDGPGDGYGGSSTSGTSLLFEMSLVTLTGILVGKADHTTLWNFGMRDMALLSKSYKLGGMLKMDTCRKAVIERVSFYHNTASADGKVTIHIDTSTSVSGERSHGNMFRDCMIYSPKYKAAATTCYGHAIKTECTGTQTNSATVFDNLFISHAANAADGYMVYHEHDTGNSNHRFVNCTFDTNDTGSGIWQLCDNCMYVNCNLDASGTYRTMMQIGDPGGGGDSAKNTQYRGHIDGYVYLSYNSRKLPQSIERTGTELAVIDTGEIVISNDLHELEGEGDVLDNLAVIAGGYSGRRLILRLKEGAGYAITIKHNNAESYAAEQNDKIICDTGADLVLATDANFAELIHDGKLWRARLVA